MLVAEDQEQVDKALSVIEDCPDLKHIVFLEPRGIHGRYDHPALMSWEEFLDRGTAAPRAAPIRRRGADGRSGPR